MSCGAGPGELPTSTTAHTRAAASPRCGPGKHVATPWGLGLAMNRRQLGFAYLSCRGPHTRPECPQEPAPSLQGVLLDSHLQLLPGCFAMSLEKAFIPGSGRECSAPVPPASRVWGRGRRPPAGPGGSSSALAAPALPVGPFLNPSGTLASKLFICLSARPSGCPSIWIREAGWLTPFAPGVCRLRGSLYFVWFYF